jgi:inhibitor of KinA sporulation pathway (predicted exonuclease)
VYSTDDEADNVKNLLDKILVIDLESTCWGADPPPGHEHEIIEIGLCLLDVATGERGENPSILIRPERSTVSEYCTQLTTLTPQEVETGISLAEACQILRNEYLSERRIWASYGDYDRRQFKRQCRERGLDSPFGDSHINVKSLFALAYNLPQEVGLDQAMALMDWPLEGVHHRGDDDAWNRGP